MKRKSEEDTTESFETKVPKSEATTSFGSAFRKKLKTDSALTVLQEFVAANTERNVVDEYVNAGGNIKELLDLLKQFDGKNNFTVASTIFAAIHHVVSRIVSDLLLKQDAAEESCKELLSTYHVTVMNMLSGSSSSTSHKKVILKLLTAMVTLSGNLARIILSSFSFSVTSLKAFTDPSSSSKSSQKLRTYFIHFLLSFLMDDNTTLIAEFLQKTGLLTSIVPGLVHDPPEIVVLVLNTLREKIVENVRISKTLKLHVFNTSVLLKISKLYDFTENPSNSCEEEAAAELEIDSVRMAAHELLLLLCTSSKKGILFRQQSNASSANSNNTIFTLLEGIEKPWENELKCHLITTIMNICPEFVENIFKKWKMDLHPRVSEDWNQQIDFVVQVVKNLKTSAPNVGKEITTLFPSFVQKIYHRSTNDASIHSHPAVRYHLLRLLQTVLQNISDALESNLVSSNVREEVAQHLQKIVIPCNKLLCAWKLGIDEGEVDEMDAHSTVPDVEEYYLVLLDVLLLYQSLIPICLSDLRATQVVNFDDYHTIVDSLEFRFKLARLIFVAYNPKPTESSFDFVMKHFVEYYAKEDDTKLLYVIEDVLRATGLFDGFEAEIIIWLYALKKYALSDLFVKALSDAARNSKQFLEQMTGLSQQFSLEVDDDEERTDFDNIDQIETLLDVEEDSLIITHPSVALSPVVFAFLHILKRREYEQDQRESVQNFTSVFLVHLMHLQLSVKPLQKLIDENEGVCIDSEVLHFVSFWNQDDLTTECPSFPSDSAEITSLLYACLLEAGSVDEISKSVNVSEETKVVLAWNACVFYTIRLEQMNELDSARRSCVSTILKQLLDKMSPAKATTCLESLLTNRYFVNRFIIEKSKRTSTLPIILLDVVLDSNCTSTSSMPKHSHSMLPYRCKLITLIMNRKREKTLRINRNEFTIDRLVKFVAFSARSVMMLLEILIPISVSQYVDKGRLSEWCELIVALLDAAANSMEIPLDDEHFVLLISRLKDARKKDVDVKILTEGIIRYIRIFPHHVQHVQKDLVEDICRIPCPQVYKLAAYLIAHHRSLADVLQEQIVKNTNGLGVEPLLQVLDRIQMVASIDERIFENIRRSHLDALTEELTGEDDLWLRKEHRKWAEKMVSQLDDETSSKICRRVEAILPTLQLNENKCAVIRILFDKLPYVKLLVEKFNELVSKNQDVLWLCDEICGSVVGEVDLSELATSPLWLNYVKSSLKIGLQTDNARIMRAFVNVCEKVLTENTTDASTLVFQMTISHSMFVNRMLGNSSMKIELIELLLVLTRLNPLVMSSNHVPLLLAAYKASLAKSDQLLLQLLQWYENNDIRFSDCRPYLWGEAAASHYSIRNEMSVSLARQPLPNQVLELFDKNIIRNTVKSFPLDRPLWPKTCCPADVDPVYDLSFMLPLLSHLLAPESRISVKKFCRSGALWLALTALSSEDSNVRLAGYHCLQRFDEHLFGRENEVQIWQQFLNSLRNGLIANNSAGENGTQPPRLACLITTFLANMSLIIGEPQDLLYAPMSKFLLAKPSFDLSTIPNFFMLFYSTDLKQNIDHQKWILRVIRDGMRYEKDWIVAQKNFLFKFVLQYYGSSLSNASLNEIILQILGNALQIEKCRLFLVTKCSLLSWLAQAIRNTTLENRSLFSPLLTILKALISTKHAESVSNLLILLLRRIMSFNVPLQQSISEELLQLLANSICLRTNRKPPSADDVRVILRLASPLLNIRTQKLFDNVLKYRSVLFRHELCDSGKIESCILRILEQYLCVK